MYQDFAIVYDEFMETVSYSEWADYIEKLYQKHGIHPELTFDMACGTGGLLLELKRRGYEIMGSDLSEEMLEQAQMKAMEEHLDVMLLQQDMRELELFGTVDVILCTCDSLNYLLTTEDLALVFRKCAAYLEAEGRLIFDMNTEYKYSTILADHVFADTYENAAFIWENTFDEASRINEYAVTFFMEEADGSYSRQEEIHQQRAFSEREILEALEAAGLEAEASYDGFTLDPPEAESERVCYVVKRKEEKHNG